MNVLGSSSTYCENTTQNPHFLSKSTCDLLYPSNPPQKEAQDSLILLPTFFSNNVTNFTNSYLEHSAQLNNPALFLYEPVKKVKLDILPAEKLNSHKESLMMNSQFRTSLGTIDEVFNSPIEAVQSQKDCPEEKLEEELNLSLSGSSSSSDTSEDSVSGIFDESDEDGSFFDGQLKEKMTSNTSQTLTIENTFFNKKQLARHNDTQNAIRPFDNELEFAPLNKPLDYTLALKGQSTNKELLSNYNAHKLSREIFFSPSEKTSHNIENLNAKRSFPFDEDVFKAKSANNAKTYVRTNSKKVETIVISECEDEGDSDSNLTGSTGLGLDSRNPSVLEGSSDKARAKFSFMGENMFETIETKERAKKVIIKERKEKEKKLNDLKHKAERNRDFRQKPDFKGFSDPWNPERRLNKLQVLKRKQDLGNEDEEMINKHTFLEDSNQKTNFNSKSKPRKQKSKEYEESEEEDEDDEFTVSIGREYQAVILPFALHKAKRRQRKVVPVWNPELVETDDLQKYTNKLAKVVDEPIISEEKAINILKMFDMNPSATLEDVKQNITSYKTMLQVKIRKHRRCATLFACYT